MRCYPAALLLCLAALTPVTPVLADSTVFSQFFGATTATPPSATESLYLFTICTNAVHGLPVLTGLPHSESIQLEQVAVDAVCQGCTGLGQSRIDSCCALATSSACFDQFAAGNGASQSTPVSASASTTALTAGGSSPTAGSSPNGAVAVQNKDLVAGSFFGAVVGVVGWLL